VKVRDLIADATFTPGASRSDPVAPRVTIILPTFRRGDSGLLGKAIDSLLGQSFSDFELIIVDDASTDSSARVIAAAMRRDPRVSVIRHARNIGLPAISEYEAYVRARGDLIAFAFDDTVFYRHGLRRLVRESERRPDALIVGYVMMASIRSELDDTRRFEALGAGAQESDLLSRNVIPNNAVLAPKAILDVVGLYDPHVSIARLCDYDLWQRVRRRFRIHFVATCVGEEHGPGRTDSLGATYPLDSWLIDDRMRQRRDELLRPDRFADLDVFETASFQSGLSRAGVEKLTALHISTRPWMSAPAPDERPSLRTPRILVIAHPLDASVQLYFEGLRDIPDLHVRFVDPRIRHVSELAGCDVLIVSRLLHSTADWVQVARVAGIPVFYFLDDNLPLMASRRELEENWRAEFTLAQLKKDVAPLEAVLTSSEALAQSFRDQKLHPKVSVLPIVVPGVVAERPRPPRAFDEPLTFALFVGAHRLRAFRRIILPGLLEAARQSGISVRLLVPDVFAKKLARQRSKALVDIRAFESSSDYFVAVRTLGELGTDVVVVPDSVTINSPYKSLHPLLTASLLGASLMVPGADPYFALADQQGVSLVDQPRTAAGWTAAFQATFARLGSAPNREQAVRADLLTTRFDPVPAAEYLIGLVGDRVAVKEPDQQLRLVQTADWLEYQLALARYSGLSSRFAGPDIADTTTDLLAELQDVVKRSRRLNAFRGRSRPSPLSRFPNAEASARDHPGSNGRNSRLELGAPLSTVPYVSYPMALSPGGYRRIRAVVWGEGVPGDLLGIEIVDPGGRIVFHAVTALPHRDQPVDVTFDARRLIVEEPGTFEVRVFARTKRLAFLLEHVDRGRFGIRRPTSTPLVHFERESDASGG
jgi:hypothetical protein